MLWMRCDFIAIHKKQRMGAPGSACKEDPEDPNAKL